MATHSRKKIKTFSQYQGDEVEIIKPHYSKLDYRNIFLRGMGEGGMRNTDKPNQSVTVKGCLCKDPLTTPSSLLKR